MQLKLGFGELQKIWVIFNNLFVIRKIKSWGNLVIEMIAGIMIARNVMQRYKCPCLMARFSAKILNNYISI